MAVLSERPSRLLLCGILVAIGTLHLVHPQPFEAMIPRPLGDPRAWTYASGAAEIAGAALLANPGTRRVGGWWIAVLFVVVFPGNIKSALDGGMPSMPSPLDSATAAWIRLPLQIPLLLWALRHARSRPLRA